MVQIIAVFTSLAFAGVIFVVMGLVFFGGGDQSVAEQQVSDAKALVQESARRTPDAWEQLASAYAGTEDFDQAIAAATKASALDPNSSAACRRWSRCRSARRRPTTRSPWCRSTARRTPKNADALLQLGQLAQTAGRTPLARLSYQTFLRLVPDEPSADAVRDQLKTAQRELVLRGARTRRPGRSPPRAPLLGSSAGR